MPQPSRAFLGGGRHAGQAPDPCALVTAAYWRFWLCVSVVYELFLIFILFQVSGFSWLDELGIRVVMWPWASEGSEAGPTEMRSVVGRP